MYILDQSRIAGIMSPGVKPGIALVPRMPQERDHDHGKYYDLYLDSNGLLSNEPWTNSITQYFEHHQRGSNVTTCSSNDHVYHEDDVCGFDLNESSVNESTANLKTFCV